LSSVSTKLGFTFTFTSWSYRETLKSINSDVDKVINLENEKNNLLIIELFKNQKKVLIPFVEEIVPLVDIKNNFLVINPPNGLLEL